MRMAFRMKITTVAVITLLVVAACTSDVVPTAAPTLAPTATVAPSATATNALVPTDPPIRPAYPLPTIFVPAQRATPVAVQTASPTKTSSIPAEILNGNYRVLFARDKHLWSVDLNGKNLQRLTPDG